MKEQTLEWLLPNNVNIARRVVFLATGLSSAEQFAHWSNSNHSTRGILAFLDDFRLLSQREPNTLREAISKYVTHYNELLDEFSTTHPESLSIIWDYYKEISGHYGGYSVVPQKLRELTDDQFAFWYFMMHKQDEASRSEVFIPEDFDFSKGFTLVEFDPKFMHGIGRYKFRDTAGKERLDIWDIREKDIPRFNYCP